MPNSEYVGKAVHVVDGVLLLSSILNFNMVLTRVKKSSVLTLQQEKTL